MSSDGKPLILWAEDSVEDTLLLNMAFKRADSPATLAAYGRAEDVIAILEGVIQGNAVKPDLLLTDLKLPGLSGFDLIAWVRAREQLNGLTVAVLSGSPLDSDTDYARELGANHYLTKPASLRGYVEIVETMMGWIGQKNPSTQAGNSPI